METVISDSDRMAIAEVDYIIHHMNEKYLNKIPQKILDYITILKKKNIEIFVDPKVPLEKQNLKEFTLYFLTILNLKYWCDDERRKEILAIMEKNQKEIDERVIDIFNKAESIEVETKKEESGMQEENIFEKKVEENSILEISKENFFVRFINKIRIKLGLE